MGPQGKVAGVMEEERVACSLWSYSSLCIGAYKGGYVLLLYGLWQHQGLGAL